jgi:hypothetical protein
VDSKKLFNLVALSIFAIAGAVGCTGGEIPPEDENVIGVKIEKVSALIPPSGAQATVVTIFDDTVDRIHRFDLVNMKLRQSLKPQKRKQKHYLLYDQNGNYTVDLTQNGLSVFDRFGNAQHNPIVLPGKPISAAFRPEHGTLVVYDDKMTVGIIKLNGDGRVTDSWVGGSIVGSGQTLQSGDLNEDGDLVLSLSNQLMAVVDVDQTLATDTWSATTFSVAHDNMSWVAPVRGAPDRFLVYTASKILLVDKNTEAVVDSLDINVSPKYLRVQKLAKYPDPHVVLKGRSEVAIAYVDGNEIKTKSMYHHFDPILASHLDLSNDTWTYIQSKFKMDFKTSIENGSLVFYQDENYTKKNRRLVRYRFSDMMNVKNQSLPDRAKLQMAETFVFGLFPSELGLATRIDINSGSKENVKGFNVKYLKKKD